MESVEQPNRRLKNTDINSSRICNEYKYSTKSGLEQGPICGDASLGRKSRNRPALTVGYLKSVSPRGVIPDPRGPFTISGSGFSSGAAGVELVKPAPAPAPDCTPDVSTPLAPTERFASRATVSLMLRPALALLRRSAFCSSVRELSGTSAKSPSASTGRSFNLGSIMYLSSPCLTHAGGKLARKEIAPAGLRL